MKDKIKECLFYSTETSKSLPAMDIYETSDLLVFEIDLPGMDIDDVSLRVYDDIVIMEGMKRETARGSQCRYLCMERGFEEFRRMIKLPVWVNTIEARASYRDGVVRVAFPKIRDRVIKIAIEKE